ncbi:MAG: hypothetical protein A2202_03165 [Bdellovibrionales bacterium RIFOXYA1_FULL_36_14]|nr:MAG: hypothetical protein A2202_03165 [Bdellovibrionales bacterium RIFOXYA1_FULL_36_14]
MFGKLPIPIQVSINFILSSLVLLISLHLFCDSAFSSNHSTLPETITLETAFKSALEKTETVPIGQSRINQAQAKGDQVNSRFLPSLSFEANYLEQEKAHKLIPETGIWGDRQSHTRLHLSQSIYEGWRNLNQRDASKFDSELQRQNLFYESSLTYISVAKTFYSVISNEVELVSLNKTIGLAKERVNEIKNRVKIGKSRNIELVATQAQLAVLEAQKIATEGELNAALDQFVLSTGLSRNVKLFEEHDQIEKPETIASYLIFMDERPDIKAAKARAQSANSHMSSAKAGHLPSVDIGANYYPTRDGARENMNWDVGITLTLPIFTGGLVNAQVREASAVKTEAEYLLVSSKRRAEIEIRTAYNSLVSAIDQNKALESALKFTEQNYKEQTKNYKFSQATNLDVISALNTYQETKRSFDRTHYQALLYWAQLKATTAQISLNSLMTNEKDY